MGLFYVFYCKKAGIHATLCLVGNATKERGRYVPRFSSEKTRCSRQDHPEKKGESTYIEYEYNRVYDPGKQYTIAKRAIIGKQSKTDPVMMQPNQNFLKYFPDVELPEEKDRTLRSSCLQIGAYSVIRKIMKDYAIPDILSAYFEEKDLSLFLDLAAYSIISENNAGQYYPDYAYNHPLFRQEMRIYSDSKVSDFLSSITENQSVGFLNDWNEKRNHREKIYFSYDSTNKNCQAGEINTNSLKFGLKKSARDANDRSGCSF